MSAGQTKFFFKSIREHQTNMSEVMKFKIWNDYIHTIEFISETIICLVKDILTGMYIFFLQIHVL